MKRLLTLALLLLCLGVLKAYAQQTVNIDKPESVTETVNLASKMLETKGLKVIVDNPPPANAVWQGQLHLGQLTTNDIIGALNTVLLPSDLVAVHIDNEVHIRKFTKIAEESKPAPKPGEPVWGNLQSWFNWAMTKATPEERDYFAHRRNRPGYDPCKFGDPGCYHAPIDAILPEVAVPAAATQMNYPGYWNYEYGRGIWYDPWYAAYFAERQRRYVDRGQEGGVKTKGKTSGVLVFARGCFIGDAQEADAAYNQKFAAPANMPMTVTLVRIKDWQAFDLPVRITDQAKNEAVGARHLTLRVHKEFFDNGHAHPFDMERAKAECEASSR